MAVLQSLPDRPTIMAMRGLVDYYCWKGLFVARKWPEKSRFPRTAGEIASSQRLTVVAKATGGIDPDVAQLFKDAMGGVAVTWIDAFRGYALGHPWVEPVESV